MKRDLLEPSIPGSKSGIKYWFYMVLGLASTSAFAGSAELWSSPQGLGITHPFAEVGEGNAAISSNPVQWQARRMWTLGFAAEQPYGLADVWTLLGHVSWNPSLGQIGLAWRHETWLGLWEQEAYRLALSGQGRGFAAGLAWEPSQRRWEGHEEWRGGNFTIGLAWRGGPFQAGFRTSADIEDLGAPLSPTAALAYSWISKRHADWGLWQIAFSLPVQSWEPDQSYWAARYTWGPGLRLDLAWQGETQAISLGLALPWGAWLWRPGWRQQGTLGRTLSSALLWHSPLD